MPGSAAAELGHLIHSLEVDCILDVGAHHGGFGRTCRRVGFAGDLISFEPSSEAFLRLTKRIERSGDAGWTAHPIALGSSPGRSRLGVFEQTQLNSLRAPAAATGQAIGREPSSYEEVAVVPLDDLWADLVPRGSKVLLKVDAQGFDLEVLKGAEMSLPKCVALQVEVSDLALYEDVPPLHAVIAYLHARSFRLTGLFPIARNPTDRLQVIDFDATFIRVDDVDATSRRPTTRSR